MEDVSGLFVSEDYVERTFDLGEGLEARCLCLDAACTDHDTTGQIVWPVSVLLACLAARSDWTGKTVVEVGAGCGLPGLAAAQYSACRVALTDGSDLVLSLLESTVRRVESRAVVRPLVWGDRGGAQDFVADIGLADVVLGADIVAWPQSVEPLLQTVAFVCKPSAVFFCGFVCRAANVRDLFYAQAVRYGFQIARLDPAAIFADKEVPPKAVLHSQLELQLLRLDRCGSPGPTAFLSDDPEAYATTSTAC